MKGGKVKIKKAWVAGSKQSFDYTGSAVAGLTLGLSTGRDLLISGSQVHGIGALFSRFNPLLDDVSGNVFCPTARFEKWVERESASFFCRQLGRDDAMRILGALYGEGLFSTCFPYPGKDDEGCFRNLDLVAALKECKDRICIFREKASIVRVKLLKVTGKDDGVWLVLKPVPSPGFYSVGTGKFEVGMNFDYIHADHGFIQTSLISWTLVTHPAMIERLSTFAAALPDTDSFLREFQVVTGVRRLGKC